MMKIVILSVIGLLLIVGSCYTVFAAKKYFKHVRTQGTDNVFSPLAIYYGYAFGIMLALTGITILCQAFN